MPEQPVQEKSYPSPTPAKTAEEPPQQLSAVPSPTVSEPAPVVAEPSPQAVKRVRVSGLVVNPAGEPVAQAEVFLFPAGSSAVSSSLRSKSAEQGSFVFMNVPAGEYSLRGRKGSGTSDLVHAASRGEDLYSIRIVVPTTGTVMGAVYDQRRQRVPGVGISALPITRKSMAPQPVRTLQSLPDGTFRIDNLELSTAITLYFSKVGFMDRQEKVEFVAGAEVVPLEIEMHDAGAITGRVTDEQGVPVPGARVFLRGSERMHLEFLQTDETGAFSAANLREPLYSIRVTAEQFAARNVSDIPVNSPEVAIVLGRGGVISGKVIFGERNPSLPFSVSVLPCNPTGLEMNEQERSASFRDPENRFVLDRLSPGDYTLKVESPDWAVVYQGSVQPLTEVIPDQVVITLHPELQLRGRTIRDDNRQVLPAVPLFLIKATGPYVPFQTVASDNEGRFSFARLPEGDYLLVAGTPEFGYKSSVFSLQPDMDPGEVIVALKNDPQVEFPFLVLPPLVGIGATLTRYDDVVRIDGVIPGGPGSDAGLLPGDLILAVDQEPVEGLPLVDVLDRIRGAENSSVVLLIDRDGSYLEKEIVREPIGF